MLNHYFFNKTLYKNFKNELNKNDIKEKSIWIWHNESEKIDVKFILNNKIYFINKSRDTSLHIQSIELPEKIEKDFSMTIKELKRHILEFKEHGSVVDSQHIIEFVNNHLKNCIAYYNLSRNDVQQIYELLVERNAQIFSNNPPATIIEHQTNKWID